MSIHIALLRAVNVGGTGKLPMADLRAICEALGFESVQTYIASGNVLFRDRKSQKAVKQALEAALADYAGKPVGVLLRSPEEMAAILENNPFPEAAPNRVIVMLLDHPPTADAITNVSHQKGEVLALGRREIYVHYGDGMADSKLQIKGAKTGTGRNINTMRKLLELAQAMAPSRGR